MQLINTPRCQCNSAFGSVLGVRDGLSQCLTCGTRLNSEAPHFVDVPDKIADLVLGLSSVADLRIYHLRPAVTSQLYLEVGKVTIIEARSERHDASARIEWGMVSFPLQSCRKELNTLRGKNIDLQKLPTATTPQMRNYLRLLSQAGFLITQIRPMDGDMAMDLEKWYGPQTEEGDTTPHAKLVVRIRLSWSRDVTRALQEVLNSLKAGLPYADTLRPSVESSLEAGIATYQLCLVLIEAARSHAHDLLVKGGRETDAFRYHRDNGLTPGQNEAYNYVVDHAEHHAGCIKQRIKELTLGVCDAQEAAELPGSKPTRLEDRRKEVVDPAIDHVRLISAAYSLFLRLPAAVIKMEAALAALSDNSAN